MVRNQRPARPATMSLADKLVGIDVDFKSIPIVYVFVEYWFISEFQVDSLKESGQY